MKVSKFLKVGLVAMFFLGMTLSVSSCGEQGAESEQTEESADDHSEEEGHEHPADGEEHPSEHPTE